MGKHEMGEAFLQRERSTRRTEAHGGGEHKSGEAHEREVSMCKEGKHMHGRWEAHTSGGKGLHTKDTGSIHA